MDPGIQDNGDIGLAVAQALEASGPEALANVEELELGAGSILKTSCRAGLCYSGLALAGLGMTAAAVPLLETSAFAAQAGGYGLGLTGAAMVLGSTGYLAATALYALKAYLETLREQENADGPSFLSVLRRETADDQMSLVFVVGRTGTAMSLFGPPIFLREDRPLERVLKREGFRPLEPSLP